MAMNTTTAEARRRAREIAASLAGDRPAARRAAWLAQAVASTTGAVMWRSLDATGRPKIQPVEFHLSLGAVCDGFVDRVLAGTSPNLTTSAPPRHGKTEWVGRGLPVRLYLADPGTPMSVLYATSSDKRAEEVSWRVRSAIEQVHALTGDRRYAPGRKWGTTEWETQGGHAWCGLGWSASTGGIGCRALIMDDLIGTSQAYRSPSIRSQIVRAVEEDLLSRIMDGGGAIHMETRRGSEDTTAYIERTYGDVWEHHVWRCHDPDRGYLWPEKYGAAWRASKPHLTDTSPIWRSLYQQEPVAEGGTLIPPDWLTATYSEPPEIAARLADRVVVGVDLAATGKTTSDHCAFVVVGVRGAYRDVLHVVRRQVGYVEAKQILRDLCATWRPSAVVVERAANGDAVIDDLASEIPGLRGERAAADKVTRLTPHLGAYAARQIRTPASPQPWVGPWREEHAAFSGTPGEPDDQVDATVWALVAADTGVSVGYADLF